MKTSTPSPHQSTELVSQMYDRTTIKEGRKDRRERELNKAKGRKTNKRVGTERYCLYEVQNWCLEMGGMLALEIRMVVTPRREHRGSVWGPLSGCKHDVVVFTLSFPVFCYSDTHL